MNVGVALALADEPALPRHMRAWLELTLADWADGLLDLDAPVG